jgi:hypothetical protein
MPKNALYKAFISRMESASDSSMHFEASWYAYAVLEDRLVSLLQNSGGVGENSGGSSGKPIRMMGPKLKELHRRAKKDELLKANFEYGQEITSCMLWAMLRCLLLILMLKLKNWRKMDVHWFANIARRADVSKNIVIK